MVGLPTPASARAGTGRAALGEPPLDLLDLRAALWRLRVGHGHGEQSPALGRAGEPCDAIHDWHALVLPRPGIRTRAPRAGSPRRPRSAPRPSAPSGAC